MIDEELIIGSVFVYEQMAFVAGASQTNKRYAGFFQYLFDFVGFFYLNQDTNTNTSTTTTTPAKTGDSSNIFLWAAVLFVSGVGIFGTIFLKKKKYDE